MGDQNRPFSQERTAGRELLSKQGKKDMRFVDISLAVSAVPRLNH
jgi:hypothetical protein